MLQSEQGFDFAAKFFILAAGFGKEGAPLVIRSWACWDLVAWARMSGFKLPDQAARMKSMVAGKPDPTPAYQVYRRRFVGTR